MKIGLFTDGFQAPFIEALDWIVEHGIEAVEIGTGNSSPAQHCNLDDLLDSEEARKTFMGEIESRGLMLSALNCNGNLLDPHPERGRNSQDIFHKTVQLAHKLGLDTIVTMSGCPGDPSGSPYPNWPVHPEQPQYAQIERWQWDEVVTPFWAKAGAFAADHGVRVAIELHPGQSAYNPRTMLRLREIAGPSVGVNLDPSHFFYQGIDPLVVIPALGDGFVFHVHAKDTRLDPQEMALNGGLDIRPMHLVAERSWAYRTLGFGHGEVWWRDFVSALRFVGYDGALSIEHEDPVMGAAEGIIKSVQFLEPIILRTLPE